jgi:hypothetical protein
MNDARASKPVTDAMVVQAIDNVATNVKAKWDAGKARRDAVMRIDRIIRKLPPNDRSRVLLLVREMWELDSLLEGES